jgi:hypothetical protein
LQVQIEIAVLPLGELELLGHARHVVSSVAPVLGEYFPAPQSVHTALEIAPMLVEYFPAPQSVHTALEIAPMLVEYFPAPQSVHTALEIAPVLVEYFPAPQSVHATLPLVVLYFPAAQAAHEPPSEPVYPMLQVQLESAVLPLGELELLRHARHVASSVAPVLGEYLPTPQLTHAALPLTVLYFPAAQAAHAPPSGPVYPEIHRQSARASLPLLEIVFIGHGTHCASCVAPMLVEYV